MASNKSTVKNNSGPSKYSVFMRKHWWKIGISLMFVTGLVFLGYNKYLDQQNVTDMKQLLADFEQLEKNTETKTGKKLKIVASCSSVGKFATSFACYVSLESIGNTWNSTLTDAVMINETSILTDFGRCRMLSNGSTGFESNEDYYTCTISVREANINTAKKIFY